MGSTLDGCGNETEEQLLRRFANGEADAATALAEMYLPLVLRYARRMLADATEAEDVAQDAMLRLWRIAPDWRSGEAKLSTWLYRVTANLCTDRLRRKRTSPLEESAEPEDPAQSAFDGLQQKSRHDALQRGLQALPERQRQAVVLRHIEGLSNPEIAEIMGTSTRSVESLTARGKTALARALEHLRAELGYENDGS